MGVLARVGSVCHLLYDMMIVCVVMHANVYLLERFFCYLEIESMHACMCVWGSICRKTRSLMEVLMVR